MAPLIQDDISFSSDEDFFDCKSIIPLHESYVAIPQTTTTAHTETRQKKSVSFGAMETVHDVISRHDFTVKELEASWYELEDLKTMKNDAKLAARKLDTGKLKESDTSTSRGVESRTRFGIRKKRQARMNAWSAVFFEIDCQYEENYFDEEALADCYFEYSEAACIDAQKIAQRDELVAKDIYADQFFVWSKEVMMQAQQQ